MNRFSRLVLLAFSCLFAVQIQASEVTLRVMSWNLEGWNQTGTSAATQAAQMAASGAQVICTQECNESLVPIYQNELQRLTNKTWYVSPPPTPNTSGPIFSTFPFVETEGKDIGRNTWGPNRTAVRVKINVNGVAINVFDTHLDIGGPPDWGAGYRDENISIIMPWINSFSGPKLFLGDMNSHWDTTWIASIQNTFFDTWAETTNPQGWSAPPTNSANWRPDYIFRSKNSNGIIRTINSWVIGTDWSLSDHRPIVADLGIAGGGTPPPVQSPYGGTAWPIPGTIQTENYDLGGEGLAYHDDSSGNSGGQYRTEGVDISATADSGGGYIVGWAGAGEWLEYTVNVSTTGNYNVGARVACNGGGGTFHIECDGVNFTGSMSVPNTGGWDSGWTTVTASNVSLTAGQHILRFVQDTVGSSGACGNFNWFSFTYAPPPQSPYGGTRWPIPGTIQTENYDLGGEGIAYHDNSAANEGGQYRNDSVDIQTTADAGGGYIVGWAGASEWLEYSVNVASAGSFNVGARVACNGGGGTFHIECDGVNVTGSMSVPNTGGWDTGWTTVTASNVSLTAGQHVLRFVQDTVGSSGACGNFNWFSFTAVPPPQTPYGGTPWPIPGTIQAENYDIGGEGVAYHDEVAGNNGAQYRNDGVDIEACSDTGGGYNVGWVGAGEWLAYTVNVTQAGSYTVTARVASAVADTKTLHVEVDGVNVTGPMSFTNSGGWQLWQSITVNNVSFTAGAHRLVIVTETGGFNLNYISIAAPANTAPVFTSGASASPNPALTGSVVNFSSAASDANGDTLSYSWNFGDGASGSGASATHVYAAAGTYTATVTVNDGRGGTASSSVSVTVSAQAWIDADVGPCGVAGSFTLSGSVFTVRASGVETIGTDDAFHFVYQQLSGDGQIIARVSSIQNTSEWAQAGIMIRESLASNSKSAQMMVTQIDRCKFRRRYTTGGSVTSSGLSPGSGMRLPQWLKLVRQGNTFTGSRSDDGVNWTVIGSDTIAMNATVLIGLTHSSANNTTLGNATIDNVSLGGSVSAASRAIDATGTSPSITGDVVDLGIFSLGDNEPVHVNLPITGSLSTESNLRWRLIKRSLPKGVKFSNGVLKGNAQLTGTFTFKVKIAGAAKGSVTTAAYKMTIQR